MNFIHLYYLLREQGKQRRYSSAVFHNSANRTKEEVEEIIKEYLLDGIFFDHTQWGVQGLGPDTNSPAAGRILHEYVGLTRGDEITLVPSAELEEFLERVRNSK